MNFEDVLHFAQLSGVLLYPIIAYLIAMGNRVSVIETHIQHLMPKDKQ